MCIRDRQKATLDGTLETQIREAASKIQPVRDVMIRRAQLIQSGVEVSDGPTLEEIISQEVEVKKSEEDEEESEGLADTVAEAVEDVVDEIKEAVSEVTGELKIGSGTTAVDAAVEGAIEVAEEIVDSVKEVAEAISGDSDADYESMTVAELKVLLKEAGKPVSGKKAELIERLKE